MNEPITLWQLIAATLIALSPYLVQMYNRRTDKQERDRTAALKEREKERVAEANAEETTWKRVVSEYERALARAHKLEQELEQLRPLALQNAVMEQRMKQCSEDKADWKDHALRLEAQLQENNIIPVPFRRNPREDTGEQLKTISRKMKAIKETHNGDAAVESPTLVFPPVERSEE